MPTTRNPRRGSLQYWPRARSRREYVRVRSWNPKGTQGLLAFSGYKAGMIRVVYKDTEKNSPTYNETLAVPCTVLECPPLRIFSARFYAHSPQGLRAIKEIRAPKLEKHAVRKIVLQKKTHDAEAFSSFPAGCVDVRVVVYTQPHKTSIGKKKPELFEVALGGSLDEKLTFVREHLEKEIPLTAAMKAGLFVDIKGVTTGKGFQGQLKRFGTKRKRHKSEKGVRRNIVGAEGQMRVLHTPPMPGKMGYHARTQYNNWLLKIVEKPEFTPFTNYGIVKNPCVIVKGSLPGPQKRMLTITRPVRSPLVEKTVPQLKVIA